MKNKNIVVIPVYKTSPDETERMSLRQCVEVLGGHEICLVCPQELDITAYTEQAGRSFRAERFEGKYFQGIEGYNDLLKSRGFYERFGSYEYMLIYQLDAWVFEDRLDYWCSKGYDYVGAPWFKNHRTHEEGYGFMCVGNGGFSLRKVSKFLTATDAAQKLYSFRQMFDVRRGERGSYRRKLKEYLLGSNRLGAFMQKRRDSWEDVFFCRDLQGTRLELNTPDCREAALFSIETSPKYIFNEINKGQFPFGCHAWKRYQYEVFWSKYIHSPHITPSLKVSIITIAYNNLTGLKDTYQSIKKQTFTNYEWIVVDGGSTDGTREFLQEHNSEIAWWCCEPDKGVYNAQNKGTGHAKGEWCIYMNSGDTFYDDSALESFFEKESDADILYGNWVTVLEDGRSVLTEAPDTLDMTFFFVENICHQALLVKREVALSRPYDESFHMYADWDAWLDLLVQGKKFEKVGHTICNFMMGGLSNKKTLETKRKEDKERLYEKYYPGPWQMTMKRVAPVLHTVRSMMTEPNADLLNLAFYEERNYLVAKRKKHNRIIRILAGVCSLLLITNIAMLICTLLNK